MEGESENPKFCVELCRCRVRLDDPLPVNSDVEVTCRYDLEGTISVSARVPRLHRSAYVELRRDGLGQLEPLESWRYRLTTGEQTPSSGIVQEIPDAPTSPNDVPATIRRYDFLCGQLSQHCLTAAVPTEALSVQRALRLQSKKKLTYSDC